jgi:hypothetical protein
VDRFQQGGNRYTLTATQLGFELAAHAFDFGEHDIDRDGVASFRDARGEIASPGSRA